MADEAINQATETQADPAANPRTEEKMFTQEQAQGFAAKEAGKAERRVLEALGLESKDQLPTLIKRLQESEQVPETLQSLAEERDTYKTKYENSAKAESELQELRKALVLTQANVPSEDRDYYAFKINKMVTEEKDFATAAKEYFEANPINVGKVSMAQPMDNTPEDRAQRIKHALGLE